MAKLFTLQDYIELRTGAAIARDLGVDEQTVYFWKSKRSAPKPHTAARLIALTNGLLSWEGIYQPFVDHHVESQLEFDFGQKK